MHLLAAHAAKRIALVEQGYRHAQTRHRLRQFQPDRARSDDRQLFGQVLQFEDAFVGQHPVPKIFERRGNEGRGAGGNHDAARLDRAAIVQSEAVRAGKGGARPYPNLIRQLGDTFTRKARETVPLVPHPLKNRRPVDIDGRHVNAELIGRVRRMGCMRGRDQQFGRHAAYRGAGGAREKRVDQYGAGPGGMGCALRSQSGGTGTYDGNVAVERIGQISLQR